LNEFLAKCAKHIYNQHSIADLANIVVVLPTRRGTAEFKLQLSKLTKLPIIAPKIVAIEDFIFQTTNLQLLEPIDLVFELFAAFKRVDDKAKFDLFMSWAPTLLKDFETIDQYLVNAKQLFGYMTAAKALERWNVDEIKSKNQNFETSVEKYFGLFKTLDEVYTIFNNSLKAKSKAYRGSAYRYLADNAADLLLADKKTTKYYFLGFNALSISEEKIINVLFDAKKAEVLWDSDQYYMQNIASGQIAGKFLKEIKKSGRYGANWNWQTNQLLTDDKNIKIIGLPNTSLQPIVAANYLKEWAKFTPNKYSKTALILADETLLPAVLSQIPPEIGQYNITMGLSLKESPLFFLFENIFEMHLFQKDNTQAKFNTRLVIKLLSHIYVKSIFLNNNLDVLQIIKNISDENQLFLTQKQLANHIRYSDFSDIVFLPWAKSPEKVLIQLRRLLDLIKPIFDLGNVLENNYLDQYHAIINRVECIVKENGENVSISGVKSMLLEIIRQTKLPFESASAEGLQIMGMLETRTLDFERIILLSTNEGNLPSGKKSVSLIPFEALREYGMPTYGHQDAIMAYHFFRLLQQAKEIIIIYTEPNGTNGNKEKSRFILQIEHELAKLNCNITLEYPEISYAFQKNGRVKSGFTIEKTIDIIEKMKRNLQEKGLSATSLNDYVRCELLFYFNRVAKIEEPSEIDEYIGNDIFGTWIHKTLEKIDLANLEKGGLIEKQELIEIKNSIRERLIVDFKASYPKLSIENGMNLILLNVAEKILTGYFANEIEFGEFPQQILAVESEVDAKLPIEVEGKQLLVKIGGKIDKIDKIGNTVRIIDYKTGNVDKNKLKFKKNENLHDNIDQLLTSPSLDKMRQLWLYKYIFLKNKAIGSGNLSALFNDNTQLKAGIYTFRNNKEGFMPGIDYFTDSADFEGDFLTVSEDILRQFFLKLFDRNSHFKMTDDLKICEYCSYKGICNR
jgi:hypothetical protein